MITSDYWSDYVTWYQHHQKCAAMILSNLELICIFLCKYGRTDEYLPVCIFMFLHLLVILSILNNIEIHNVINKYLWNRYDVWSTPIVLAQHRTVSRAYLCHAIVSHMASFASCIKPIYIYKWPHQRHQNWSYVTTMSKLECELYVIWKYERNDEYLLVYILMFIYQLNRIKYSQ